MLPVTIFLVVLIYTTKIHAINVPGLFSSTTEGDLTFYGAGADSGGTCSYNAPRTSLSDVLPTIAIGSSNDWQDALKCGMCVNITPTGSGSGVSDFPTRPSFIAYVNNQCPECGEYNIDLAQTSDGRWGITWKAVDCPVSGNIDLQLKSGSSIYHTEIQARNFRVPIQSVDFLLGGSWTNIPRKSYNYFVWNNQVTPPVPIRMTSIFGDQVYYNLTSSDYSSLEPNIITTNVQFSSSGSGTPQVPSPIPSPSSPTPSSTSTTASTSTTGSTSTSTTASTSTTGSPSIPSDCSSGTNNDCLLYMSGGALNCIYEDWSYGYTPMYDSSGVSIDITSNWNALYISCPSTSGLCITVTNSTTIQFEAFGGSGSSGNQEIQILFNSGNAAVGSTVRITLTANVWATYTVQVSQFQVPSSTTSISGIQFQAFSAQLNQIQIKLRNIIITNSGCSSVNEPSTSATGELRWNWIIFAFVVVVLTAGILN